MSSVRHNKSYVYENNNKYRPKFSKTVREESVEAIYDRLKSSQSQQEKKHTKIEKNENS